MKNKIYTGLAALLILTPALLLEGCAHKQPIEWTVTQQTNMQIRHNYLRSLRAEGVQVIRVGQTIKVVLHTDRMFAPSSANLYRSYQSVLTTVANYVRTFKTGTVVVTGYSDNVVRGRGVKDHKQLLTALQAQVVSDFLWSRRIKTSLIVAQGVGKHKAVAWNGSYLGRSINRRIEVTFRFYPTYKSYD